MRDLNPARREILNGWKEIASYLGKGVRTAQRYERELALPIHRLAGKSQAAVSARQDELDDWRTSGRSQIESLPRRRALHLRTNSLRVNFMRIDSEIALTFASMALSATDPEKKRRTAAIARKAYDTIIRLWDGTDLGDADRDKLEVNLRRLKSQLRTLGQNL